MNKRNIVGIFLAGLLSFNNLFAQSEPAHATIHFYRVNSLREPKGSEFEVFFNDKQAFLLGIGARVCRRDEVTRASKPC